MKKMWKIERVGSNKDKVTTDVKVFLFIYFFSSFTENFHNKTLLFIYFFKSKNDFINYVMHQSKIFAIIKSYFYAFQWWCFKGRTFHEAFEFIKTFAMILAIISPLTKFINHSYILNYVKVYSRMLHVHDLRRMPNERSEDF